MDIGRGVALQARPAPCFRRGVWMDAEELLRANDIEAALAQLLDEVRADPANAKLRVFLFRLCVTAIERAKTQLTLGWHGWTARCSWVIYGERVGCEAERAKVFSGERATTDGDPQPWMAELYEALRTVRGEACLPPPICAIALDAARPRAAWIDGQTSRGCPMRSRLGRCSKPSSRPLFRASVHAPHAMRSRHPTDLRDQVWMRQNHSR